jgi:hypothetical protein
VLERFLVLLVALGAPLGITLQVEQSQRLQVLVKLEL